MGKKILLLVVFLGFLLASGLVLGNIYPVGTLKARNECVPWRTLDPELNEPVVLAAPSSGSYDTIDGKKGASCAILDFGASYNLPIVLNFTRTSNAGCGASCLGSCDANPGGYVFVSDTGEISNWDFVSELEDHTEYSEQTVNPDRNYRYAMVCRSNANGGNYYLGDIYLESEDEMDAYKYIFEEWASNEISLGIVDTFQYSFNALGSDCTALVHGYNRYGNTTYIEEAIKIGDYIAENSDWDNDGFIGWGWDPTYDYDGHGGSSGCTATYGLGSWDAGQDGTCNPPNTEMVFQTGRSISCLANLYTVTKNPIYLDVINETVEDWWDNGVYTNDAGCEGCFYYWYTSNQNEVGQYVRNTNLEMGEILAFLYNFTGDSKYGDRAIGVLNAEKFEQDSGNYGYLKGEKSCTENHYPAHAWLINSIQGILGLDTYTQYLRPIIDLWRDDGGGDCPWNWEGNKIVTSNTATGTYAFYVCGLKDTDPYFRSLCTKEVQDLGRSGDKPNRFQVWFSNEYRPTNYMSYASPTTTSSSTTTTINQTRGTETSNETTTTLNITNETTTTIQVTTTTLDLCGNGICESIETNALCSEDCPIVISESTTTTTASSLDKKIEEAEKLIKELSRLIKNAKSLGIEDERVVLAENYLSSASLSVAEGDYQTASDTATRAKNILELKVGDSVDNSDGSNPIFTIIGILVILGIISAVGWYAYKEGLFDKVLDKFKK